MSTQAEQSSFGFLESYVEQVLRGAGFESMSDETRDMFVPQFVAEAEQRLGDVLIPRLSQSDRDQLDVLLTKTTATQDEVRSFWITSVPDFDTVVAQVLETFKKDVVSVLEKNK